MKMLFFLFFIIGDDKPKTADLVSFVNPKFAHKWETIGRLLGLHQHSINIISKDNTYNPNREEDACIQMLKMWLKSDASATWDKLDAAIKVAIDTGMCTITKS